MESARAPPHLPSPRGIGERPGIATPYVDILERDDAYVVTADLPGVAKEEVHAWVEGDVVILRAESRREREAGGEEEGYLRRERSHRAFQRRIALPGLVDADQASSRFANGVLEITLPKLEGGGRKEIPLGGE